MLRRQAEDVDVMLLILGFTAGVWHLHEECRGGIPEDLITCWNRGTIPEAQ